MPVPELKKQTKKTYYIHDEKNFINKKYHHSDGSIFTRCFVDSFMNDNVKKYEIYTICKIRDCDRTIHLSFALNDEKDLKNAEYKIDTIISNLLNFKEALIKSYNLKKQLENDGSDNTTKNTITTS